MSQKEKKGTLNDLIKKIVAKKINQYLGKYLKDIKSRIASVFDAWDSGFHQKKG